MGLAEVPRGTVQLKLIEPYADTQRGRRHLLASSDSENEEEKRKWNQRQRKVTFFTVALGAVIAGAALGGLFVALLLGGASEGGNPYLLVLLSVGGLAIGLVAADYLTKKLLAKWIA